MSAHITLSALLELNPGKELVVDADRPISVLCAGVPWICTAVLERTAILVSGSDPNDRHPVRHENLMVDPAGVQWREIALRPSGGKRSASPWRASQSAPRSADGKKQRDLSDDRARKNQAEVAATDKRELEVQLAASRAEAAEAVKSDAFYAPDIHVVEDEPTVPTEGSGLATFSTRAFAPMVTIVRDVRQVGVCAKCGQTGRLDAQGNCQRHAPRASSGPRKPTTPGVMPSRTPPQGDDSETWHGTLGGYKNHRCRCERCTRANADQHHDYMVRRRATDGIEPTGEGSEPSPAVAISPAPPDAAPVTKTPSGAFTELLNDLRQLSAYALGLEQDNARLQTENEQLRDEQAGLYDELHAIVGGIKKATTERKSAR